MGFSALGLDPVELGCVVLKKSAWKSVYKISDLNVVQELHFCSPGFLRHLAPQRILHIPEAHVLEILLNMASMYHIGDC